MPEGTEPTLHNADNKVTPDYVYLTLCEKYSIDPLKWYGVEPLGWQSPEGIALKTLMFAKRVLDADEEKRHMDEIEQQTGKNKDKPKSKRGR